MTDLLISLHVPRDLVPGMINLFSWSLCVTLGIFGLFILRLYLRSKVKKRMMARESMSMSMMDIDTMRTRGLVSDAEYKAIRHSLAEREVERERRRKQAERERLILDQVAEDPEAARQLLAAAPARKPAPRESARPQPQTARAAMNDLEREQACLFELSSTDTVLPELLQQPAARPAAQRPAQARPQSAAHPAQAPAPRPAPAQPRPASVQEKPVSDLELLLRKGAITPEEYQRLKAFVR